MMSIKSSKVPVWILLCLLICTVSDIGADWISGKSVLGEMNLDLIFNRYGALSNVPGLFTSTYLTVGFFWIAGALLLCSIFALTNRRIEFSKTQKLCLCYTILRPIVLLGILCAHFVLVVIPIEGGGKIAVTIDMCISAIKSVISMFDLMFWDILIISYIPIIAIAIFDIVKMFKSYAYKKIQKDF